MRDTATIVQLRRYDPAYRLARHTLNYTLVICLGLLVWFSQDQASTWLAWAIVASGIVVAISAVILVTRTIALKRRLV